MDNLLFPGGIDVVRAAVDRHAPVWAFAHEAVQLGHQAQVRMLNFGASFIPGTPRTRRVRNDTNDDVWRFMRSISDPLVQAGHIRAFVQVDGGDLMILPDGMHVRIKKGDNAGQTSNYPTPHILGLARRSDQACLFSAAPPLDEAIMQGVVFDAVYVAGRVAGEFKQFGLKMAVADSSAFVIVDVPDDEQLRTISPSAFDLAADARSRLAS